MAPRVACLLVAALVAAGCVEKDGPMEESAGGLVVDSNRPAPQFGEVVTGPAVGPDVNATTEAAPRLVEGEWWRIRFASPFSGEKLEFVRVVANTTPEGYIFGMPHEGWYKEAIAYHAPAFGDVHLNLSYATHNVLFEPLRFPMRTGDTWTTYFAATKVIATVENADLHTAVVAFKSGSAAQPTDPITDRLYLTGSLDMKLTYDARMHEVVKMESFAGNWEVVQHGYDFEGWVTVPRGEHTAIDYGTLGPAAPNQPLISRTIRVEGGFNRLTMMHVIVGVTPGKYHIRSTPPEGKEFFTEAFASTQTLMVKFYEATNPDGTWRQEDVVVGPGATYSMGIAYHQYDIRLPDGARRSDHSHAVIR